MLYCVPLNYGILKIELFSFENVDSYGSSNEKLSKKIHNSHKYKDRLLIYAGGKRNNQVFISNVPI